MVITLPNVDVIIFKMLNAICYDIIIISVYRQISMDQKLFFSVSREKCSSRILRLASQKYSCERYGSLAFQLWKSWSATPRTLWQACSQCWCLYNWSGLCMGITRDIKLKNNVMAHISVCDSLQIKQPIY